MKKYIFPSLTVLGLAIGFVLGIIFGERANAQRFVMFNNVPPANTKIDQLMNYVSTYYVDKIDTDSLTESVMIDILGKLDPHSAYIAKEDLEIVNSELEGSFSGIGVQFNIQNDTISIVAVIAGGPSEGVGILAGDKIVEVNDSLFVGKTINNEKVMHTLRGPKGTEVSLSVKRAGVDELLHFTITRGDIPVHSVNASFMLTPSIGFVRVGKFGENTYNEFITALALLKKQGATSYIIDLRENSGGYMEQAIKMVNEFLSKGDMIVYAEGNTYPRYEAKANGLGRFQSVPLVVLIDDFSASASEIFSGAMQDNDRATIIGRRSFGKGLVQQQIPFSDGSAMRLTVARYYTPSGRCIQKHYDLGAADDYNNELLNRFEHGEFYSKDSITLSDTTVYYTKQGRIVHGGGGIMPDIFVGRDTSLNTPYYNQVTNLAYTYQFAYRYTDTNRKQLSRYKDWQSLEKYLNQANWMPEFVKFCADKGVQPAPEQLKKSEPLIRQWVNAYIVRNILGDEGFYPLVERDDEITKQAVKTLQKQ